jgi:hypothetical protein
MKLSLRCRSTALGFLELLEFWLVAQLHYGLT